MMRASIVMMTMMMMLMMMMTMMFSFELACLVNHVQGQKTTPVSETYCLIAFSRRSQFSWVRTSISIDDGDDNVYVNLKNQTLTGVGL